MKTITLEELHDQTERILSEVAQNSVVVTKNGRPQAVLRPYPDEAALRQYWQEREQMLSQLPSSTSDSTVYISEDREGR